MEAIVLAGGLGTRLRSVVDHLPKPMAPVAGRPFLAYVLDQLVGGGFRTAVLAVGYRHDAIRAYFGDVYDGLRLRYSIEAEPAGTGGAIRQAAALTSAGDVFVLNGDTYLALDFARMFDAHRRAGAGLTVAVCHVPDVKRYGALELRDGVVTGFREKGGSGAGWVNAGTYVLGAALRERLPDLEAFSFEQDVLVPQVATIRPVAFVANGQFIDIGVPDDYARAQLMFESSR